MKKFILYSLALSLLANCGSDPASKDENTKKKDNYLAMQADLTGAVKLAVSVPEQRGGGRHLLKVTANGKFEEIFNDGYTLFSYKLTPTHIIAHVNIWEDKEEHCSLIAIPKIQGKTSVLCLNKDLVYCEWDGVERNFTGYDVHGSEVYFAIQEKTEYHGNQIPCELDGRYQTNSELRSWDGKSEKVTTLFRVEHGRKPDPLMVRDVFVSEKNRNLCIDMDNGGDGSLFCKKEGATEWKRMLGTGSGGFSIPFLKQNNKILASGNSIDLDTFELSARKGDLPAKVDFPLMNGGFLGRSSTGVIKILPNGESETLSIGNMVPAQVGNWAWYAGSYSLKRANLKDGALDPNEYVQESKITNIRKLFWSIGEYLRIEGTGVNGMPAISYLDIQGALAHVSYPPVNVEHPIDLKWEN